MKVMIKRLVIGYGLLLTLATGGLVFAYIFRSAVTAMQFGGENADAAGAVTKWTHIGWVFGVCVALLGAVMQWRKKQTKSAIGELPKKSVEERDQTSSKGPRHGFLASAAWGGSSARCLVQLWE